MFAAILLGLFAAGCVELRSVPELPPEMALRYSPQPGLLEDTAGALARLERAGKMGLLLSNDGTPVSMSDSVETQEDTDKEVCANTFVTSYKEGGRKVVVDVEISLSPLPDLVRLNCGTVESIIVHEVIHSLRRGLTDPHHSEHGVFRESMSEPWLEETSLLAACEDQDCLVFQVER